jgi:hypothetical protein
MAVLELSAVPAVLEEYELLEVSLEITLEQYKQVHIQILILI